MEILPTHSEGPRPAAAYRDAVDTQLATDRRATDVRIFAYAITDAGWQWLRTRLRTWRSLTPGRTVELFLGLDNDATHPAALRAVLKEYPRSSYIVDSASCFHPKAFLFEDDRGAYLLCGSNNLSGRGLSANFELSTGSRIERDTIEYQALDAWQRAVRSLSSPLTAARIRIYSEEWEHNRLLPRGIRSSGTLRAKSRKPGIASNLPYPHAAIVEALTETGGKNGRGTQLGLPWPVAHELFGLKPHGQTMVKAIAPDGSEYMRTMTYFKKVTYRLSIPELASAKRPRVVVMQLEHHSRVAASSSTTPGVDPPDEDVSATVRYSVVSGVDHPALFARLYGLCRVWPNTQKRWVMFENSEKVRDLLADALNPRRGRSGAQVPRSQPGNAARSYIGRP